MIINTVGRSSGGAGGGSFIQIYADAPQYIEGKYISVMLGDTEIFGDTISDGVTSVQVDIEETGYYTINVYDEPAETSDGDEEETHTIHVESLTANYSVHIGPNMIMLSKTEPIIHDSEVTTGSNGQTITALNVTHDKGGYVHLITTSNYSPSKTNTPQKLRLTIDGSTFLTKGWWCTQHVALGTLDNMTPLSSGPAFLTPAATTGNILSLITYTLQLKYGTVNYNSDTSEFIILPMPLRFNNSFKVEIVPYSSSYPVTTSRVLTLYSLNQ